MPLGSQDALAKASEKVVRLELEQESLKQHKQSELHQRIAAQKESFVILEEIADNLCKTILQFAPPAIQNSARGAVLLGNGKLDFIFNVDAHFNKNPFKFCKWDLLSFATIIVSQTSPHYVFGANLLYANKGDSEYRWYEVSFMTLSLHKTIFEPFAAELGKISDVDLALSNVMHSWQLAWGPIAIDLEGQADFIDRWASVFAKAAEGKMAGPGQLPISRSFFK